jgi:hypothetical protein
MHASNARTACHAIVCPQQGWGIGETSVLELAQFTSALAVGPCRIDPQRQRPLVVAARIRPEHADRSTPTGATSPRPQPHGVSRIQHAACCVACSCVLYLACVFVLSASDAQRRPTHREHQQLRRPHVPVRICREHPRKLAHSKQTNKQTNKQETQARVLRESAAKGKGCRAKRNVQSRAAPDPFRCFCHGTAVCTQASSRQVRLLSQPEAHSNNRSRLIGTEESTGMAVRQPQRTAECMHVGARARMCYCVGHCSGGQSRTVSSACGCSSRSAASETRTSSGCKRSTAT